MVQSLPFSGVFTIAPAPITCPTVALCVWSEWNLGGHLHGLAGGSCLQLEIHDSVLLNVELECGILVSLETRMFDPDSVSPNFERSNDIRSVLPRRGGDLLRRSLVGDRHLRIREYGAGRILDRSKNGAGIHLSESGRNTEDQHANCQ